MFTLTRKQPRRNGTSACGGSWSMTVKCTAAAGVDANVFVFHAVSDVDNVSNDTYSHVASLAQMSDFPVGAPDNVPLGEEDINGTANYIPFYRTNEVELSFPNAVMMEHTWRVMRQEVAQLVAEYKSFERMNMEEEVEL